MNQSYSDNDLGMSPTQILERLQVLRQLQLLQRGKLQKQRLQYQETSENSSGFTEIVSHFSSSTSSNLFRSLVQSPREDYENSSPLITADASQKLNERDLLEGVSVLNLSQESEFIIKSPNSAKSRGSSRQENVPSECLNQMEPNIMCTKNKSPAKKRVSLDEMPILSPKQDFEQLILEKLKNEIAPAQKISKNESKLNSLIKRPFLKRGEGMARFGLGKKDLVIQNTKSLPWRSQIFKNKIVESPKHTQFKRKEDLPIKIPESKLSPIINRNITDLRIPETKEQHTSQDHSQKSDVTNSTSPESLIKPYQKIIAMPKGKHPLNSNKGNTWAAILTKEQNDFLTQLKQSEYYKNFGSPAKSIGSETSCDENLSKATQEREAAEQNMFELLENKVSSESFDLESSFFNRFFKKRHFDCSGESTPLIMQKCLAANPNLLHIVSDLKQRKRNESSRTELETCQSEYTECCSDACSTASSCCSCQTVEPSQSQICNNNKKDFMSIRAKTNINRKEVEKEIGNDKCQTDTVTENDLMKANIAEMNTKLINTSELLKERLHELEDEIETFRKENSNLGKLKEEIDLERQKFYEEKKGFEQKFNEEKVLSEYYLAEEREKITKQKQMYERYVREMRGKLSKKDRDEVINLKKEIEKLKEEIKVKDAKSTTAIARFRNQIKIMEKEKKDMITEIEKLKKENRRIKHSNDITRRVTNMKYLAEINKKLTNMTSKETRSEVDVDCDSKYKAFEIDRQSRSRKRENAINATIRPRAKSVPNLKVTSRYAKYFSQRDSISQMEQNDLINIERLSANSGSDVGTVDDLEEDRNSISGEAESINSREDIENGDENKLEKLYMETFQSISPKSNVSRRSNNRNQSGCLSANDFFLRQSNSGSNSVRSSKSPTQESGLHSYNSSGPSRSPVSIFTNRMSNRSPFNTHQSNEHITNLSGGSNHSHRSKSPVSVISNHSHSLRSSTVIHNDQYRDKLMVVSPEPFPKTSSTKSNLNPTEIRKPDGSKELRFPNGNVKLISNDGKYSKFIYYNGDIKENFYSEGRIKYFYAETKTYHTTHPDGLEVLEFPDGQVEKRYKDGSTEIRLPNGSVRYFDPKNEHVREEWRFPDGATLTVSANGEQRIVFANGQVEVHAVDHKRREFPDGTVKMVYNDGTSETRYASGRVRIKDKHGNLIMDSAPG